MFLRFFMLLTGIINCSAYETLSRGKSTEQYQTWECHDPEHCRLYESQNAVDENLDSCMRTKTINSRSLKFTWWYVDLGGVRSIYSITILFQSFNRDDKRQNGRFAGFSLFLSNSTNKEEGYRCYIDGPELPPLDFNTTCIGYGRYIIYYNERLPEGEYPEGYPDGYPEGFQQISVTELCDVEVQGCNKTGMYGPNCNQRCPEACQERRCFIVNGTCLGCKPGWFGDSCDEECPVGKYGLECKNVCSGHCKGNVTCHHVTGQCNDGCAAGWTGTKCDKECPDGTYGDNCIFNCSGHCLHEKSCNTISGKCDNGCRPGYTNDKCNQVCTAGYFGVKCADKCSKHCQNKNECDHVTGFCKSGCMDGYIGGICQQACSQGHYGPNCSKNCSNTCSNSSCYNEDGHCDFGCEAGYRGSNCSEKCGSETFGKKCKKRCSAHCITNETCNHITGICDNGCANGYRGSMCDSACSAGHFGKNCSENCSLKCMNTCNNVDGSCDCTPGWKGIPNCNEECPSGYFGVNCIHQCSRHCAYNDTCNKVNGSCPRGCQKTYTGYQCQCKALNSEVTDSVKTDVTDIRTIGLILSIALNVILLCVLLLPLTRAVLNKRKSHEDSNAILGAGIYQTEKDTDQQYQDLGTLTQASNYQELRQLDIKCVYQNYAIGQSE